MEQLRQIKAFQRDDENKKMSKTDKMPRGVKVIVETIKRLKY